MNRLITYTSIALMMFVLGSCTQKTSKSNTSQSGVEGKPNVILIMTDDQGFGDLGYYGNPHIKTPVLDKFAGESVRFDEFLVSPVCAPTRSALMTGRYTLRTGVRETYQGGAMMAASEITLAEILKDVGYKTGMIGKWHLGDNYPMRPEDQGFDYTLRHLSGGIGQWGDWPNHLKGNRSYFDPALFENGKMVESRGYCSDVFTDAAIQFLEENQTDPFFLYLAFNAPHDPLQVPQEYYEMYKDIDPASGFENDSRPFPEMNENMKEKARKVYAMVTNIDDNMGRLLTKMDELNLSENTLVIFMSDNGPIPYRYLAGMRGRKSSVYEGGIQVPCFWRYPNGFKPDRDIKATASHFDIFPTIAQLVGATIPTDRKIDGISLLPLLTGEASELPERNICRYWSRREPRKFDNMMIRNSRFKLVGNCSENATIDEFELFSLNDPYEQHNIVEGHKETATALKTDLNNWIDEMLTEPNAKESPRMILGTVNENPSVLNLNDVHFTRHKAVTKSIVYWKTEVAQSGVYNIDLFFKKPITTDCEIELLINDRKYSFFFEDDAADRFSLGKINLEAGETDIIPVVLLKQLDKYVYEMPFYLEITNESI
ncbi:arylsulfatase [Draconibacterium sp.]|uniref:arylsulfatase n=1 Tax=Draconibacterium sp. TaxID=1965318 RepID=UPI0035624D79